MDKIMENINSAIRDGIRKGRDSVKETENMILTKEQIDNLKESAKPLMKALSELGHPHFKAIVDYGDLEVFESKMSFKTDDYVLD